MPHDAHLRPAWLIRLGLFLYDNLSQRHFFPGSRTIKFESHTSGQPLQDRFVKGFEYSDAWVDDARLVVLNAMSAHELGATILTRTKLIGAHPEKNGWRVELLDRKQQIISVFARCMVNATGPWTGSFLKQQVPLNKKHQEIKLVKGSHIITKKLFDHPYAYIFQITDHRVIFAIPYLDQYTLIGTTDLEFEGDPDNVTITDEEVSYLCDSVNSYFKHAISPKDVLWTYSGVRPLLDQIDVRDPSSLTRDYRLQLSSIEQAPLLSIFGGKITTFRRLSEEAVDMLTPLLTTRDPGWTSTSTLPGGNIPQGDFNSFLSNFLHNHRWLPQPLAKRYAHNYGTRALRLLKGAACMADLGEELSPGLFEQEARYLVTHEWAREVDDILWRRTKLGLMATSESTVRLAQWLAQY
jgi:glycerol-3-phosphate dehydrogenase